MSKRVILKVPIRSDLSKLPLPIEASAAALAELRQVLEFEEELARTRRIRMPAPSAETLQKFLQSPDATRRQILAGLAASAEFLKAVHGPGPNPPAPSERRLLELALAKLGLLGDAGDWEQIESDDVLEVYDSELRQVYRSFNCFAICNYSILDLTIYPFYELYERHSGIMARLMEGCGLVLSGKAAFHSFASVPEYHLKELRTARPKSFAMREKFLSRLASTVDGLVYFLSVKKIRPLGGEDVQSTIRYL